jgi:mannose-1-phosphate guanylyltransferase
MLGFRTDDPRSCGILELDDRGTVVAFHEKVDDPPGNLANGAVYIFEPEVIDAITAIGRPAVDLSTEIIPHFAGRILCVETNGYHRDIGTPERLRRACAEFGQRPRARATVGGRSI